MASVSAIRAALATNLGTISGLRIVANEPDRLNPPAAAVGLTSLTFDQTFGRGLDVFELVVRLYASRADDRAGQDRLDAFLAGSGALSVKAALEADKSLAGIAQSLHVTAVENYGVYDVGGTGYYGAEFSVTVWTRGT